jgi:hypothetical protein
MHADWFDSYIGGGQPEIVFSKPVFSPDFAVGQIREDRPPRLTAAVTLRPIFRVYLTLNLALLIEVFCGFPQSLQANEWTSGLAGTW